MKHGLAIRFLIAFFEQGRTTIDSTDESRTCPGSMDAPTPPQPPMDANRLLL